MRGKIPLISHQKGVAQVLSLENKARKHWRKYLPALTEALEKEGIFESEIKSACEMARKELAGLVKNGAQIEAAKEIVMKEYIFLPLVPQRMILSIFIPVRPVHFALADRVLYYPNTNSVEGQNI